MTTATLSLDKIDDNFREGLRWTRQHADKDFEALGEDTSLRGRALFWIGRANNPSVEDGPSSEGGTEGRVKVRLVDVEGSGGKPRSPFRGSLAALDELRTRASGADWLETAFVLKRDVRRLRETNYSRHASVLLALADALTFTLSDEVASGGVGSLVTHAFGLLSEPFIPEDDEAEFLGTLLTAGWNLAPASS